MPNTGTYSEMVNLHRELFNRGIEFSLSEKDREALGVEAKRIYFRGTDVFLDGKRVEYPADRRFYREHFFGWDPLILLGGETIPIDRAEERIKSIAGRDVKFTIRTRKGERPVIEFRERLPRDVRRRIERELEGFYRIEYSGGWRRKLAALGIIGLLAGFAGAGVYCGIGKSCENVSNTVKLEKADKPQVKNVTEQNLTKLGKNISYEVNQSTLVGDTKDKKYSLNVSHSNHSSVKENSSVKWFKQVNQSRKRMSERERKKLELEAKILRDVKACPYNTSEYVKGKFDCSNMAKMLYDWLTERGHKCTVVYIENKTYDIKHNFLFVDGYAVEPTWKGWASWYYQKWFKIDKIKYLKPWQMRGDAFKYPRRW